MAKQFEILTPQPQSAKSLRSLAQHQAYIERQHAEALIQAARQFAKDQHGIDIGTADARRIAQEFAWLMGRSNEHPGDVPVHAPDSRAEAAAIISAGARRRGEGGAFGKGDATPRDPTGRPLAKGSEAELIVLAGRRARGEVT